MRRRPRTQYTETQKALMWERWKKGETLHQIARLFDRPHTSIRQILAETGGIRPPQRRRSRLNPPSKADVGAERGVCLIQLSWRETRRVGTTSRLSAPLTVGLPQTRRPALRKRP
jgi:hypothetical protein